MSNKIHIIGGPTASGKSARALAIAGERGGVIINADAMQVYRELPILTAQPPAEEQAVVPHKLYSIFAADEVCSAGIWAALAEKAIRECWAAGQYPVVVGGTGLYIKALMDGFSPIPDVDVEVRKRVGELWKKMGAQKFHNMLLEKDTAIAEKLEVNDRQRHIRAMEVLEATGKRLSEWQAEPRVAAFARECFEVEIILPEREELYARCDARFDWMLANGALKEVRSAAIPKDSLAAHALGYAELSDYLAGKMSLEKATERAKQMTRNYAKRQMTWFRNQI